MCIWEQWNILTPHRFGQNGCQFGCVSGCEWVGVVGLRARGYNAMNAMIRVNLKEDPRIAECFPNDPYSNICILTATQKLHLQQAFLSMDSEFFSQVDLRHLPEQPLIRLIHSLYGAQLVLNSLAQLRELYPIILELGIEDYRQNILAEIEHRREILESVEFIEVSHRYGLWWEKVLEVHMQGRLRALEDARNYLQLSKVGAEAFNALASEFWGRFGEPEGKALNNVLENYLNRNNLKPLVYLRAHLPQLLPLWLKYHHVSAYEMVALRTTPLIEEEDTRARKKTEQLHRRSVEDPVEVKRRRVAELEAEIRFKDAMILDLAQQIEEVRRELGISNEQREITAQSLLISAANSDLPTPLMKKNKRLAEMSPEVHSDEEPEKEEKEEKEKEKLFADVKEPKTFMHRLGSKNIRKL